MDHKSAPFLIESKKPTIISLDILLFTRRYKFFLNKWKMVNVNLNGFSPTNKIFISKLNIFV